MTSAAPKGAAPPTDQDTDFRVAPQLNSKLAPSRSAPQASRYTQAEIEHECWILMGELDEARRSRERLAANKRGRR